MCRNKEELKASFNANCLLHTCRNKEELKVPVNESLNRICIVEIRKN